MRRNRLFVLFALFLLGPLWAVAGKESGQWKDLYVKVGDIKIHYLEAGTGDRTLIFIPGWTMTAEVWKEQIPYFSSRGFRVIAYDPRSHGLTTKTETGNTYAQHAADLHAFLKSLKAEHSYLVGWSAGVTTLLEYISSPESIKPEKMIFVDGGPALLKMDDYPGQMTLIQARWPLSYQEDRAKAIGQVVGSMFKQQHPGWLFKDLEDGCSKTPNDAAFSLLIDIFTGDRRPALARVPVPSLIITTEENRQMGEYMKSKIPRSNLEIIENAGHAIFLDKPQAFNQALESFLGEH
jgi:non-heme chloroperoxidase